MVCYKCDVLPRNYKVIVLSELIRRQNMAVSYNRLWKLLIDKKMTKTRLIKEAGSTTNVMAHLSKDEDVRVESLVKICNALNCTVDEIMEILPEKTIMKEG